MVRYKKQGYLLSFAFLLLVKLLFATKIFESVVDLCFVARNLFLFLLKKKKPSKLCYNLGNLK